MKTRGYEVDEKTFTAEAYTVDGWSKGIAFSVYGWETQPDEDTEWTGEEIRTGKVVVCMIGDDRKWTVDPEDLTPLKRDEYCGECGQVGCGHDGMERA